MVEFISDGESIPSAPRKDPNAIIDYGCNWVSWLATSETISTSTWILSSTDLTSVSESNSTTATSIFISGGVPGKKYLITNRITTNQSRTEDRSMFVEVKSK